MPKICPKCGQPNPDEAAFCHNCSAPLGSQGPVIGARPEQQWGQQNFGGSPQSGGASTRATVSLILAAAGLLCCGPLLAIPAAIVGWMELNAIKNGQSPPAGRWMAQVGLWVGIVASILHVGAWVLYILMVMLSAASNPYGY